LRSFSEIDKSLFAETHFSERLTFTESRKANRKEFPINPVYVRKTIMTRMESSWVYFWSIGKKRGFMTPLSALTSWQINRNKVQLCYNHICQYSICYNTMLKIASEKLTVFLYSPTFNEVGKSDLFATLPIFEVDIFLLRVKNI
jgi:hypothetical protein